MALTVVSFYTRDTPYVVEAAILRASLDSVGMAHHIVSVPDRGDWDRNTARKAGFLRTCRRFHRGPILWIDADAFVHANCTDYFERLAASGVDFGIHYFRGPAKGHNRNDVRDVGWWPLSGTLFVNDTVGARTMLDMWVAENDAQERAGNYAGGGQRNLQTVLPRATNAGVVVARLPGRYCFVWDKPWAYDEGEPCIIEHTIASRENRDPRRSLSHLVKARRERVAQLRARVGV